MLSPGSCAFLEVRGGVRTSACAHRGLFYYNASVDFFLCFFFLRGMTVFSLYNTPSCICDSAGVSRRRSDAGFVTTAVKRPARERTGSGFIGFNFLLFAMQTGSSGNVNVDAGCRGTLQAPGDVACEAKSDSNCCTLVALSSTKPQKSLNSWSKQRIRKGCVDLTFDVFLSHQIFSFNDPTFNSIYKRIFTWMCGCSKSVGIKSIGRGGIYDKNWLVNRPSHS